LVARSRYLKTLVANNRVYTADQFTTPAADFTWGVRAFNENGDVLWNAVQVSSTVHAMAADGNGTFLSGALESSTFGNLTVTYSGSNKDGFIAGIKSTQALPPLSFSALPEDKNDLSRRLGGAGAKQCDCRRTGTV
jgi:hypothetical protein